MIQLINICHKLTVRKFIGKGAICALLLSIIMCPNVAKAKEENYPTSSNGDAYIEIGVNEDNYITLTSEKVVIDASADELTDKLIANVTATYSLSNAMAENTSCYLAVTKVLKVKKIEVNTEEAKTHKSGEFITANNRQYNGYIYPIATKKKLTSNSAYNNETDAFAHVNYLSYYKEAFKKFESLDLNSYSQTADCYVLADDGEEKVCVVVYELKFNSLETKEVVVKNSINGSLKRPFKETRYGSTFSFTCVGDNLSSFYSVKDIEFTYKFSDNEDLGFVSCDGPIYTVNDVYTQRYKGKYSDFTFKVGKELTEEEINDIWASHGNGKKLIDILEIVGTALIALSAMYIVFSIKKRKQSGIGTDINNYFSS